LRVPRAGVQGLGRGVVLPLGAGLLGAAEEPARDTQQGIGSRGQAAGKWGWLV
jgi:hypothetical protein